MLYNSFDGSFAMHSLCGVVLERPPRVCEVAGSISGQVISPTLTMVVTGVLLGTQVARLALRLTG